MIWISLWYWKQFKGFDIMFEYKTKVEQHGMALQICQIGSRRYVKIIHIESGLAVVHHKHFPYEGSLKPLYDRFIELAKYPLPNNVTSIKAFNDLDEPIQDMVRSFGQFNSQGFFD
jgi:hypothetical protein